jgi:predicted ATPase
MRYMSQGLDRFHVLVGPNASGKSTFLDVIAFLGDIVREGPLRATQKRAPSYQEMVWQKETKLVELAIESEIPGEIEAKRKGKERLVCRYEVSLGEDPETKEFGLVNEALWLKPKGITEIRQLSFFPFPGGSPHSIIGSIARREKEGWQRIVYKGKGRNDQFRAKGGFIHAFRLGSQKSALGNLPEDEEKFPVATWFRRFLQDGIQLLNLNSESMRKPSPPGLSRDFLPDGSNLPWIIDGMRTNHRQKFDEWIEHIRTALPDLRTIKVVNRPEDKHSYLVLSYDNGLEIPSWLVSDGTLRMLVLTLLAYLPNAEGVFLVEEPENGIHPRAIQTVFQSLTSVYGAQVLLATHSPVILSIAKAKEVLCFAKTDKGATDIVRGSEHPALKNWKGDVTLDVLFASGVLGQ